MRARLCQWIAAALLFALAQPATASLLPVPEEPAPEPSAAPAQTIGATSEAGSDERIAGRIRGIFGSLPSLEGVSVKVSQGVVALSGTVADAGAIDRAEEIAGRIEGVVTVENLIERDVSVESSLTSLGGVTETLHKIPRMLPLIGVAVLIGLLIAAIGYLLSSFGIVWRRLAPNQFLAQLIASAIRFAFVLGGIVAALNMIGAGALLGAVLGGAGIIGIALGFAMRDTIENYVASIMLSLRQPFRANDWVVIDSYEGRIIRLTSRATIVMTLDGNHLRIPNSQVFKAVILNYTRNPQRRFEFTLGIDADDDPTVARHLGRDVLLTLPFVLDEPEPQARVIEVGDSNIVIKFLGWIDQRKTDWYKAQSRAIPAVKIALEDAGFAIPEPIYRLRFDARTTPLPFENISESERATGSRSAEADARPRPAPVEEDTAPSNEVARMVDAERAGAGDEKDLLDSGRPVE